MSDFYLRVRSRPIIEDSDGVQFVNYCLKYEGIEEDLVVAVLDKETGNWANVDDFKWLRAMQSPNWSILPEEERVGDKPDLVGFIEFLKPLNEVITKANAMTEGRRSNCFNQLKAATDSLSAIWEKIMHVGKSLLWLRITYILILDILDLLVKGCVISGMNNIHHANVAKACISPIEWGSMLCHNSSFMIIRMDSLKQLQSLTPEANQLLLMPT
ncbi:hypothetical protein EZV62_018011 [Acer yangbiense]|uniref:C-CAP/cofactor C-like domain-containing protein n=1 Tax=Acer yangbiense TaxID=1000413 RepID=A0A5C7HIK5_9ROSI|nr:hypothetical protein EZV62_018011 [Acer yangbiense]